jgi:hypothetical protein
VAESGVTFAGKLKGSYRGAIFPAAFLAGLDLFQALVGPSFFEEEIGASVKFA